MINLKKNLLITLFILNLTIFSLINPIFAITTDITFHSKFEKPINETNNLNFSGYPAHSFKQYTQNYNFIKDSREVERKYIDFKRDYNNQRKGKFDERYEVPNDLYKFEKKYQENDYSNYKFDYYNLNKPKINFFKEQGLRFKSSESHFRNDY